MRSLSLLAIGLAACTTSDPSPEDRVTIGAGIYGEALGVPDVAGEKVQPLADVQVRVFYVDGDRLELAATRTDAHGFYELEGVGSVIVCALDGTPAQYDLQGQASCAGPCTLITVDGRTRADFALGFGMYWSAGDTCGTPR